MKKYNIIFIVLLSSFFFSCSNVNNQRAQNQNIQTLKKIISEKDKQLKWTNELDPSRLEIEINKKERIQDDSFVTFENISVLKNFSPKVFPQIEDFTILDLSQLNHNQIEFINNFLTEVSKDITGDGQNLFVNKFNMNYVFFINDLIEGWNSYFCEDFPQSKLLITDEEQKNQNIEIEEKETIEQIFENWIIGKPYIFDNLIEVPVRIFCKPGKIDVIMYMNTQEPSALYQINFTKWNKNDE